MNFQCTIYALYSALNFLKWTEKVSIPCTLLFAKEPIGPTGLEGETEPTSSVSKRSGLAALTDEPTGARLGLNKLLQAGG